MHSQSVTAIHRPTRFLCSGPVTKVTTGLGVFHIS
jgi:hypothetical protein